MASAGKPQGSELFIVDNSDQDWKVLNYLRDWCKLSEKIDIATGFFEIGSLLALRDEWRKVDQIRILMGDEVSKRTRDMFLKAIGDIKKCLDNSLEKEKQQNDFLVGVPAIVEAIRSGKILCRVYRKNKFHAKAYITHARPEFSVVGSSALVGSSNFTFPGLTENIELNVQITGRQVTPLQEWYDRHWAESEDVSDEVLRVIEHHTAEYSPFDIYAKALQEYFRGHEMTATEWELSESSMYPVLDQYQKEGYHALQKIAKNHRGAFLCDGVGLGKTFVGLMLIERLVMYDRKRVVLFVPKAARKPVWESAIRRYLPHIGPSTDFSSFVIFNHTDLLRGGDYQERLDRIAQLADVVVIDEAHHFRNPGIKGEGRRGPSRYRRLFDIAEGKSLFMLTATPINNKLIDLQHMIELFSRRQPDYFKAAPLGIHSLPGHFRRMEKALERLLHGNHLEQTLGDIFTETNIAEAEQILSNDALFRALVIQRSRAYVVESQKQQGGNQLLFPTRERPRLADYSIKKTYGRVLSQIEKAFNKAKPLFNLAIYYPYAYLRQPILEKGTDYLFEENRQIQVVGLIRTQFLKRFESSARAFELSCEELLLKLLAFAEKHSKTPLETKHLEQWKARHDDVLQHVKQHHNELFPRSADRDQEEGDEDLITDEMLAQIEDLDRETYNIEAILSETFGDLDQIVLFLNELMKFKPSHDDKLRALIKLLKSDPVLSKHKVLIFTEYMSTARYLKKELESAGITGVDEVDSAVKRDRGQIIRQFSPYYNDSSSAELAEASLAETRVLISTDVLSEGLNLQDATRLINYDLHWNPVRLMQRIGRVDRRLSAETEALILENHPEQKTIRGNIVYWNFLPPEELDMLLGLYSTVSHKTLRISKVFGIEGRQLLTPDDDYEALKDFIHSYEGTPNFDEKLRLEYKNLLNEHPGLESRLKTLPGRVFSGKHHPSPDAKAVFFCYALPAPAVDTENTAENEPQQWSEEAGYTQWYLYDLATGSIAQEPSEIADIIRSTPETPRHRGIADETLSEIRAKLDKHIKNTYLKQVQAPVGIKPTLKAWMELS